MSTIAPIHPGEVLMEEFLTPLEVTQNRLAVAIGVPPRRINEIVHGKRRVDAGQLEGRAYKHTGISFWGDANLTDDRQKVEWVVRGKPGDRVELVARHERAGTVRTHVILP